MKAFAYAISFSLFAASPAMAVTAISGGVAAGTNIVVGDNSDTDSAADTALGVPGALSASATSSASVNPDVTASVFSSVVASWASANAGSMTFNWGWDIPQTNVNTLVETNKVPEGWSYSFTTGASGAKFNLDWDTSVFGGSTFGLQGLYGSGGLPFNVTPFAFEPAAGSGSFVVDLAGNTAYNFGIFNFGNLGSSSGFASTTSSNVNLRWNIVDNGVPEPANWAMMIVGFGLVGGLMRSRRLHGAHAFA